MKKFKIKSFCKINLTLKILKRIKSNFHVINSLITFCNIYDIIYLFETKDKKDTIKFTGKFKKGIKEKKNTVTKLLYLLRKNGFLKKTFFKIKIKKNIPHGSGLGGGSSNAAYLLNFLNENFNLKLNKFYLHKIANQIGFDVPISLEKKNTFFNGQNSSLLRLKKKLMFNILIVYPNLFCSTKRIYNKNTIISSSKGKFNFNKYNKTKLINFLKSENNDLQKTVIKLYPKVQKVIYSIENQKGCYFARITGSGSACFGIFANRRTAIYAQKLIKMKFPKYWCVISKTI